MTKRKNPWDRAQLAPRILPPAKALEEKRCECGHLLQLHEGFHVGNPRKCCFFEPGGRNKCRCKKYLKAA